MSRSQLYSEITEALHFLPETFLAKGQTLDAAFDAYRLHKTLSPSNLDLILMSYRYAHLFARVATKFSTKKIKPAPLKDLWLIGFTALMTRDKVPPAAIVSECVEVAKAKFGPHTSGVTNAFLRGVDRQRAELQAELEKNPTSIFPDWLVSRWGEAHDLAPLARSFVTRPAPGVSGFGGDLKHRRIEWSESAFENNKFQAMDAGSFAFCEWVAGKLKDTDRAMLDTCAAPGGKAIYFLQHLRARAAGAPLTFALCEAKPARMTQLKENLERWEIENFASSLHVVEWGKDTPPTAVTSSAWDFVLCDLPCSGSGTLLTRPDVLFRDLDKSVESLRPVQAGILQDVRSLKSKKLFVSVCSADPVEVKNISQMLGQEPDFKPWPNATEGAEGITGWYCGE